MPTFARKLKNTNLVAESMLAPGTSLQGRYRIVRQLARGGMGTVYEAVDERLDATVALKEMAFGDEELRKQFEREARLLARLQHAALPRVSDHFSEADGQFLVMQFVGGSDLSDMLRERGSPFPAREVIAWADQLLDALDYLHTQEPPVIHRDIKPHNLKLGGRGQIMLLDFGLAKGYASRTSPLGSAASVVGYTPAYAPLEQIQGAGTDARSDLYSLAATLYHLLTGVPPPNALARADATLNGEPDPLRPADELSAQVSSDVAAVLRQALSLRRDQRISTAAAMRRALSEADKTPRTHAHAGGLSTVAMSPRGTSPQVRAANTEQPAPPTIAHAANQPNVSEATPTLPSPSPPASAQTPARSRLIVGGLAALFLAGIVGVVLMLTVFRKSDSSNVNVDAAGKTDARQAAPASTPAGSDTTSTDAETPSAVSEGVLTLKGHERGARAAVFSPDGRLVASGGEDGSVKLWDAKTGELLQTSSSMGNSTSPVAFAADGQTLAVAIAYVSASNECGVVLLDSGAGRIGAERLRVRAPICPVNSAALSADGQTLAAGSNQVFLWDVRTGALRHTLEGHTATTESLAFSPDGLTLASAGNVSGEVKLWDVLTGRLVRAFKAHAAPTAVAFSPDGSTLATGGYDGKLRMWAASGDAPKLTLDYGTSSVVTSIAFSPDGRLVACGGNNGQGQLRVWDAQTGAPKASFKTDGFATSVAFSRAGDALACGTSSGAVVIFDVGAAVISNTD